MEVMISGLGFEMKNLKSRISSNHETERNRGGLNWPPPARRSLLHERVRARLQGAALSPHLHQRGRQQGQPRRRGQPGEQLREQQPTGTDADAMFRSRPQQLQTWAPLSVSAVAFSDGEHNTKFSHNIKCCTPPWLSSHSSANLSLFLAGG